MKQCSRCGIDEEDPRAKQACAAIDSESPYHRFVDALPFDVEGEDQSGPCELCCTSPCVCSQDDDGDKIGVLDNCPRCTRRAPLSAASERSVTFDEPLCDKCRAACIHELHMDAFDRDYERARANGWAD